MQKMWKRGYLIRKVGNVGEMILNKKVVFFCEVDEATDLNDIYIAGRRALNEHWK